MHLFTLGDNCEKTWHLLLKLMVDWSEPLKQSCKKAGCYLCQHEPPPKKNEILWGHHMDDNTSTKKSPGAQSRALSRCHLEVVKGGFGHEDIMYLILMRQKVSTNLREKRWSVVMSVPL